MLYHLHRVEYGRSDTPPKDREYRVREFQEHFGRSPVGSVSEIADFIREQLQQSDFILEIYDPLASPDANRRVGFGQYASEVI